jgi:GWxTD domain-containing protein
MNVLDTFARSAIAEALGWSLLHFLWQGAIVAATAAVALKAFANARVRYAIACLALFSMPVIFAWTLWHSVPHGTPHVAGAAVAVRLAPAPVPDGDSSPDLAAYLRWASPLWLAGVLLIATYRAAAWIFAIRLRRRGTRTVPTEWIARLKTLSARIGVLRPVLLFESALAEVPVMIGWLRPAILVPLGMLVQLPADQVEAILLHELAHIRRADYLVSILQSAVEALLFYHPAVWWISGVMRAERENCCDDLVLASQADPHVYATALLSIEQGRSAFEPALAANNGDLLKRVRRVLRTSEARSSGFPAVVALALVLVAAVAFAGKPQSPPPQSQNELTGPFKKWVTEDVAYIITEAERKAFNALNTDDEREHFIQQFWDRRDPTPGTPQNEFRDEHYRRIAAANTRFADANLPGWKTDRGRIYITFGPPDEMEVHNTGDARKPYPFQQWLYRHLDGIGNNVIVEFDDKNHTGEFRMTMDPNPATGTPVPKPAPQAQLKVIATAPGELTATMPPQDASVAVRVTNASGLSVAWFDQTVSKSGAALLKKIQLPPGAYTVAIAIKNTATGESSTQSVNIEVK